MLFIINKIFIILLNFFFLFQQSRAGGGWVASGYRTARQYSPPTCHHAYFHKSDFFFIATALTHSFECVCGVKHIILCKKYVSRRRRRGRIYTRTHALLVVFDATVEFFSARFNARDVPVDSHGHVLIFIYFFSFFHQFDRDFHVQINI